ncbi:Organic hydroperoxide resistance transcriptional regulator [Tritonibacter multivorans]|uniref:Organic hydroperoxide resistance transcriptional regulator n=2 Tax=Tritonibacter multivorans TaxID=928856 RepID=A0A0P1GEL4_9RHOB|nr:MarR family transcriptional regulator [Tritonibacter multivorans]CUH79420.1 Organic hydroperoxide resistance transcriptional regulator [Tritonibacter multivorans]SFC09970.1 transcriptional regulator, MarR family [Tritonibacter multivorans]
MTLKMTLDDQLCFSIYSASHAIARMYRPLLDPMGLTYPQYLVLLALWERDGRRVRELGADLLLDSNTLTPLLKRMQAADLVARTRNPEDERSVLVSLTEKGHALRAQAEDMAPCVAKAMGDDMEELAELRDRLHRLRARLDGADQPA